MIPRLAGAERPRSPLGEAVALGVGGLERSQLGSRIRIEGGSQRARDLAGGERAEDLDLGGLESLGDPLGLLEQRIASPAAARLDLYREQDLVLLGDPRVSR